MSAIVSPRKTVRDKMENIPTTKAYFLASLVAAVSAIALLVIGLMNAELLLSEKGFFGMAFTLSLFATVTVQKNVRDSQQPDQDEELPLFKEEVAAPHKLHIAKGTSD